MQAATVIQPRIDGRMIGQILAIIDRRPLDLANGSVDFLDGDMLVPFDLEVAAFARQMSPCVTQIVQRMKISGVSPGNCLGAAVQREEHRKRNRRENRKREDFHWQLCITFSPWGK